MNYIDAITLGFPTVDAHAAGDPLIYSNIVWDAGDPIPAQVALDAWILSNPAATATANAITRYEFRKLFTLAERIAVDNVQTNTSIAANYKQMLLTMAKDMELSSDVELYNPDVAAGVNLLESIGIIAVGRAAQILANQPPV